MAIGDIYQDSDSIHVDGNPTLISGSKRVQRDPSTPMNWWGVVQPTGIANVPRDSAGRWMRFCSAGHYEPIDHFGKNRARKDGKDNYCQSCRRAINRRAEKTAAGK